MKVLIEDVINNIDIIDEEMEIDNLMVMANNLSNHQDSEIKVYHENASNYITAITGDSIGKWKIDYPVEINKIHQQRYVSKEQCLYYLKKIYQGNDLKPEDNFIDVPVGHFTLDEMLEFKKEDEMMLSGEDPDMESSTPAQSKNLEKPKNNPPKSKSTSKTLQQLEASTSREITPNKVKSVVEKVIKRDPKPSDDGSFFQI